MTAQPQLKAALHDSHMLMHAWKRQNTELFKSVENNQGTYTGIQRAAKLCCVVQLWSCGSYLRMPVMAAKPQGISFLILGFKWVLKSG